MSPLILRLSCFTKLSQEDRLALDRISRPARDVAPRRDIIREGDKPKHIDLIVDGWACRYKMLADGRRQTVSFLVPGDFCDLNVHILREMDHNIGAITRVRVAEPSREEMGSITENHPRVSQALWWHELVSAAAQREWTLNIGQRTAYERIAHLFAELFFRLRAVGLADGDNCAFPLSQTDIAEATGLTAVHVNRMLQEMRADGLIELEHRRLRIPDLDRLIGAAMFNPNYLHLDREGRHLDAND